MLKTYFDFLKIPNVYSADIFEHLDTLYKYGTECAHITELGFRTGTSFTAFLLAQPKKLVTYDITFPPGCHEHFDKMRGNTEIHMHQESSLACTIEETDLLFIDTLHNYDQLKQELYLHGNKSMKYIICHDTEKFGDMGENGRKPGLMQALNEFMHDYPHWQIKEVFTNNNGLLILHRVEDVETE